MIRALGFLTVVGRSTPPDRSTVEWFPLVGVAVGAAVGGIWLGAGHLWPRGLAAAVAVVADLAITGMLHFDGLVDTADGALPHLDRERRLAVMAEPTVGAFGVAAAVAVLLLRWASLAAIAPKVLLLAALWCVARTVMAVTVRAVPYAREGGGLVSGFIGGRGWIPVGITGAVLAVGLGLLADGIRGVVSVGIAALAGAGVVGFCRRRLGGYTGDVLGAAGILAETIGLLVAAARW